MHRFFGQYIHYLALVLAVGIFAWNNLDIHYFVPAPNTWLEEGVPEFSSLTPNPWTLDDAYISMRYAENFANGHGLRFNPGQQAVEGYTTFLWVFLLGVGHWLGAPLPILAKVLGATFALGTLVLLAFTHRVIPGTTPRVSAIAVLMLGSAGMFNLWSMSSMEVPMVTFWALAAVFMHINSREKPYSLKRVSFAAFLCALAALSRPEMVIVFLVCFVERLYCSVRDRDLNFFYFGLVFTMFFLPFLVWRFWYYGYWVPNTFYAKVGANYMVQAQRGLEYLSKFCRATFFILAPGITGLFMIDALRQRFISVGIFGAIVLVDMVYIMVVGGDFMPASRFLVPFLPMVCVIAALTVGLLVRSSLQVCVVVLIMVVYAQFHFYTAPDHKRRTITGNVGRNGKVVGEWMRENLPEDAVLATNTAGSIPFYSKLQCIDMLGLNDAHIAHRELESLGMGALGHEKGDGKYVLDQKPDYIQFGSASGAKSPRSFLGDREIARDPRFKRHYELKTYTLPNGLPLQLFKRRANPVEATETSPRLREQNSNLRPSPVAPVRKPRPRPTPNVEVEGEE